MSDFKHLHFCLSSDYRKSIGSKALVGYAAIDGDTEGFVLLLAEYLSCDPSNANSDATSIDIFGLND